MAMGENELRERVRRLEGKTVYTIERCKPNKILRVTTDKVEIEGRITSPSREDIFGVYQYLHCVGRVTKKELESYFGNSFTNKVGRIIMAILAKAVPKEIEAIKRSKTERLSGIKLRG